jgi:hypothetical protein
MTITLHITNPEEIRQLWAAGSEDLKDFFFPKIGIHPDLVSMRRIPDERARLLQDGIPTDTARKSQCD